ncbi:molybdenum cofactor guanylyltransferase [Hippea sp. KM1]|uniref:molybdenum cofactor guanylyltransferase n=1 Tax=Hippea sp. KM1 TaxID=944481 RepID=UPI00046D6087|nr:molybdenum cofactor guanylyltransferase [Hippea sp. KM1]
MKLLFCILAGGRSKRFNKDKRRINLLGKRLIDYPIESIESLKQKPILSLRFDDDFKTNHPAIKDQRPFLGPLCGILNVMEHFEADFYIFLTADMPFITPELLKTMTERLTDEFDAYVFECNGIRLFPLSLSKRAKESLKNQGCANRSIRSFIEKLHLKTIPWRNCMDFFNINTEEDLKRALSYLDSKAE